MLCAVKVETASGGTRFTRGKRIVRNAGNGVCGYNELNQGVSLSKSTEGPCLQGAPVVTDYRLDGSPTERSVPRMDSRDGLISRSKHRARAM